jgi:hypothetical protein
MGTATSLLLAGVLGGLGGFIGAYLKRNPWAAQAPTQGAEDHRGEGPALAATWALKFPIGAPLSTSRHTEGTRSVR